MSLLDSVNRSLSVDLPDCPTLDDCIGSVLPKVRPFSEDLREEEYWLGKRWLEVTDSHDPSGAILHIFLEEGEYLHSLEGNITKGMWRTLDGTNTLILELPGMMGDELYDLVFLDSTFFILKKHGDHYPRFRVFGVERAVRNLEWRECMDLLFNRYRNNPYFIWVLAIIMVIATILLALSLY